MLRRLRHRCQAYARSRCGQRVLRVLSLLFTVGLMVHLGGALTRIGWVEVWGAIPRRPAFYLAFLAFYLCLPLCECAIYGLLWNCPARLSLPVLLRKRVFSRFLLDYSGEAYLYLWARRSINLPQRHILHTIKDNIIISTAASTAVGLLTLVYMLWIGVIGVPAGLQYHRAAEAAVAALVLVGLTTAGIRFRRRILSLPLRQVSRLFALHGARLVALMALQVLLWSLADPGVGLRSWLRLLAADVVISRIPFVPNRDFVLLGTGLEMADGMGAALPMLAGMLLTVSVLEKLFGLLLLVWSAAPGSRPGTVEPARSTLPAGT
ncbi:MAG: hypothetical protein AB1505_13060 [Candidatus Latescibacterota bacterium]